ncbi:hypothetical protein NQ314_016806 [Rhamnusium bicolor]|uniref:YqaJ viral recombinase domain-containing protein n=1 Tax=Rhamnusium bicolor TaxID=1586634 RepID=A0AAV8WW54_9CUCU|nr:hypothetical protein NQ314_016806 [Rhamnusium bicolor]
MSEKHVISFTTVADFFKENIKQLQRGENSYNSGNGQNMTFDGETKLSSGNVVGFTWLLRPHCEEDVEVIFPSIEDVKFSNEYLDTSDKKKYIIEKCCITASQVKLVVEMTVGQASNENWLIARKNRITASNFGAVLAVVKRSRYPISLFRRLTGGYDLSSARAIQWGKEHEKGLNVS